MTQCAICDDPVINRGGAYCARCAAMHAVMTWEEVKKTRLEEKKRKREQRSIFEF